MSPLWCGLVYDALNGFDLNKSQTSKLTKSNLFERNYSNALRSCRVHRFLLLIKGETSTKLLKRRQKMVFSTENVIVWLRMRLFNGECDCSTENTTVRANVNISNTPCMHFDNEASNLRKEMAKKITSSKKKYDKLKRAQCETIINNGNEWTHFQTISTWGITKEKREQKNGSKELLTDFWKREKLSNFFCWLPLAVSVTQKLASETSSLYSFVCLQIRSHLCGACVHVHCALCCIRYALNLAKKM